MVSIQQGSFLSLQSRKFTIIETFWNIIALNMLKKVNENEKFSLSRQIMSFFSIFKKIIANALLCKVNEHISTEFKYSNKVIQKITFVSFKYGAKYLKPINTYCSWCCCWLKIIVPCFDITLKQLWNTHVQYTLRYDTHLCVRA